MFRCCPRIEAADKTAVHEVLHVPRVNSIRLWGYQGDTNWVSNRCVPSRPCINLFPDPIISCDRSTREKKQDSQGMLLCRVWCMKWENKSIDLLFPKYFREKYDFSNEIRPPRKTSFLSLLFPSLFSNFHVRSYANSSSETMNND